MENRVTPLVEKGNQMLLSCSQENQQMKEMIRRFDEVLSEKASKVSLDQYSQDAKTTYITI